MEFSISQPHCWMAGRRIVDLQELARQMHCQRCKSLLDLNRTVNESLFGLASVLYIKCHCGDVNELHTSKKQSAGDGERLVYEINCRASVNLMMCNGVGAQNVINFLQILLEIPIPSDTSLAVPVHTDVPAVSSVTGLSLPVSMTVNAYTYSPSVTAAGINPQMSGHLIQMPQHPVPVHLHQQQQHHPQPVHPVASKPQQLLIIPKHPNSAQSKVDVLHIDAVKPNGSCAFCPPCPHTRMNLQISNTCGGGVDSASIFTSGCSGSTTFTIASNTSGPTNNKQSSTKKVRPSPSLLQAPKVKLTKDERDDLKVNTKCVVCKVVFRSREHYRMHRILHPQICKKKKKVRCTRCSADFPDQKRLKAHMASHAETEHKCAMCEKTFCTKAVLNQHVNRIHLKENSFTCNFCGKKTVDKAEMKEHLAAHGDVKPWPCAHCEKSFKSKANLHAHMRSHAGSVKYACPHCSYCFLRQSDLDQHLISKHVDVVLQKQLPDRTFDVVSSRAAVSSVSHHSHSQTHLATATHTSGTPQDTLTSAVSALHNAMFYH